MHKTEQVAHTVVPSKSGLLWKDTAWVFQFEQVFFNSCNVDIFLESHQRTKHLKLPRFIFFALNFVFIKSKIDSDLRFQKKSFEKTSSLFCFLQFDTKCGKSYQWIDSNTLWFEADISAICIYKLTKMQCRLCRVCIYLGLVAKSALKQPTQLLLLTYNPLTNCNSTN